MADLSDLVDRARLAQRHWEQTPIDERAKELAKASAYVLRHADDLRRALEVDQGARHSGRDATEIFYTAATLTHWATNGPQWLRPTSASDVTPKVRWRARGLVVVIGPANFPLTNGFGDCIPALLAGNSVILKPSPRAVTSANLLAVALHESGLPTDVFTISVGGPHAALALVDLADYVAFTGSQAAAKATAARAALKLTPTTLEIGTKDR